MSRPGGTDAVGEEDVAILSQRKRTIAVVGPILLVAGGIFWAWLWSSVIHIVPLFYLIAPAVDVAAYGFVGVRVHHRMQCLDTRSSPSATLSVLAMALFYTGNRLIWLGWALGVWPFGGAGWPDWIFVVWEFLVIFVGLIAATGMWKQQTVRRWTSLPWSV